MSKERYDRYQKWLFLVEIAVFGFATGVALTKGDEVATAMFLCATVFAVWLIGREKTPNE